MANDFEGWSLAWEALTMVPSLWRFQISRPPPNQLIFYVIVENADLAKIGKNTPWQMTLKAGFCHPYGHLKFPAPLKISKVAVILTLFKFIISL